MSASTAVTSCGTGTIIAPSWNVLSPSHVSEDAVVRGELVEHRFFRSMARPKVASRAESGLPTVYLMIGRSAPRG